VSAPSPFGRLDELTAIAGRFEDEFDRQPGDRARLAPGHERTMDARTAEINRLLGEGIPAGEIREHLDEAGQ
jgi:phenylalanyl-tRNA synthetase beta subunit